MDNKLCAYLPRLYKADRLVVCVIQANVAAASCLFKDCVSGHHFPIGFDGLTSVFLSSLFTDDMLGADSEIALTANKSGAGVTKSGGLGYLETAKAYD